MTLRTNQSKKLRLVLEKFIKDKSNYTLHQQGIILSQILGAKLELARENLWDYCECLAPDFYRDDRPHLQELATLLGFLYLGKLKVPSHMKVAGELVPVEDTGVELDIGAVWKKFMMNLPPQHGKSRTLTNAASWIFGKNNEERILLASYNDDTANDFSKYTRDIIKEEKTDPNDPLEIVYSDIFPKTKLKFGSATFKQWALEGQHFNYKGGGVGGAFTSKGGTILMIDDPIKNAEEALNQAALERVWNFLTGTFMSRVSAEGGEPIEILNMTRWAEKDPCGRFMDGKEEYYLGDTPFEIDGQTFYFPHLWCFGKWLLLKMDVIEPSGEMLCPSIFSRTRYEELEEAMPQAILEANYRQKPIDIEGKLFKKDELMYFTREEFDALEKNNAIEGSVVYCDVADEGDDSFSAPFGKIVDQYIYVTDVVFTKDPVEKTSLTLANKIHSNECQISYFESNNGGKTFALLTREKHKQLCEEIGDTISSTYRWRANAQNKDTRIYMQSEYIKKHVKFLHPSQYAKNSEYGKFMQELWDYNSEGSNVHDDAPDSIHGLSKLLQAILKKRKRGATKRGSHSKKEVEESSGGVAEKAQKKPHRL